MFQKNCVFQALKNRIHRCFKKNALAGVLCLSLFLSALLAVPAYAQGWPEPSAPIQAEGAILIDADSGAVLYGKNRDTPYYPASITKVMTAVVVLENVKDLDETVTFSSDAVGKNLEDNATVIGAVAGDKLSVRDCLYSLLLHSANDAANALAEHVAGSNDKFAELMNKKAEELGCTNTHFNNPSGLNNPDHYTSCSDMAKIMAYAIKNPQFRQIDQTQYYKHAPITRYPNPDDPVNTVYAHHRMMRKNASEYYAGVFAGKTGYTMAAGNTLVTACERNGMTLICVILNGHLTQYSDSKTLFDYGYNNFTSLSVSQNDTAYSSLQNDFTVSGIPLTDMLSFSISDSDKITLPKTAAFTEASSTLSYDLTDSEKADGAAAKISYTYAGHAVGTAYLRLEDTSTQLAAASADAQALESRTQETVPESISVPTGAQSAADSAAQQTAAAAGTRSHAPISIDRTTGKIVIPPVLFQVAAVLGVILVLVLLGYGIRALWARRGEYARMQRRTKILKRTRDLSRAQKTRRDLLMNNRYRDGKKRRKR